MARLWETGFETGGIEWNGGNSSFSGSGLAFTTTQKRTGSYSLEVIAVSSSTASGFIRQIFDDDKTELFGRMVVRFNEFAAQFNVRILRFMDAMAATQLTVAYNSGTFGLDIYNGAGTLLAVGNVIIPADTWVVIEWHLVVGASGSLTVKINGTTSTVFSGDTDYTNYGSVRSVRVESTNIGGGSNGDARAYIDDIAVNDTEGSYQNSWIGLGGVYWLYPTADGYQNDWTPSAGSDNYATVDERPPNTIDYVQALDAADLDLYELFDTPEYVARINLLRVMYRAAVTTAGSNDLRDVIRVDSVNHAGDTFTVVPLIPSFTLYTGPAYYLNPETSAEWAVAEVDALEAGFEIV